MDVLSDSGAIRDATAPMIFPLQLTPIADGAECHGACLWVPDGPCQEPATQMMNRLMSTPLCDQHARAAVEFVLINLTGEQLTYTRQAQALQPEIDRLNMLLNGLSPLWSDTTGG
jgi:hypothetical protein